MIVRLTNQAQRRRAAAKQGPPSAAARCYALANLASWPFRRYRREPAGPSNNLREPIAECRKAQPNRPDLVSERPEAADATIGLHFKALFNTVRQIQGHNECASAAVARSKASVAVRCKRGLGGLVMNGQSSTHR